MNFDLDGIAIKNPDSVARFFIPHVRTGEPTAIYFDLYSPDSAVALKVEREIGQEALDRIGKKGKVELDYEVQRRVARRKLMACVAEWNVTAGGKKVEPTQENIQAFFEAAPHAVEFLQSEHNDRANFIDE